MRSTHLSTTRLLALAATVSVGALACMSSAAAQNSTAGFHVDAAADTDASVRAYWTPERLLGARNLDLKATGSIKHGRAPALSKGARQVVHGGLPTEAYDPSEELMLPEAPHAKGTGVVPNLVGTSGAPYTTNRLYPVGDVARHFPYSAVGHLFFSTPNGNFQCSASVIRASTIATAGHCVADGNGTYYSNWLFIPAENGSSGPFGSWTWATAWTSSAWWSGGGTVPNEQDDALIVLAPKTIRGVVHHIGDYTGYFGYEYNAPMPTSIAQLGYPCNLDNCSDPIASYAQVYSGPDNNYIWGTYSFGGASGGPEVQDFGVAPSGVPAETLGGNIVVSSTSYTYNDPNIQADGGSVFYAPGQNGERTFGDLINWACSVSGC